MGPFELPAVALDHVGIAAADADSPLAALLGLGGGLASEGRAMKSGVTVARFGPGRALELVWPGRPGTPIDASWGGAGRGYITSRCGLTSRSPRFAAGWSMPALK